MQPLNIDHNEIERRKQFQRDLWDYRPVDHIPPFIWPTWTFGHTQREITSDGAIQLETNYQTIEKCLRLLPDDYIPWARIWCGYMTIATMFGIDVHWSDDPDQAPGIKQHLITNLEDVFSLRKPELLTGLMPENLSRLRQHAQSLPPDVSLSGIDAGGPLNTCKDILDTNLLYTAFYDNPRALHYLLNLVTEVQLEIYQAIVPAAGGLKRMTCIDFDPMWAPEKYKGFVSDDVCATINPKFFNEFSIAYNNRLYAPYGSGLLHNCGPNPCKFHYLEHTPRLKGLSLAYKYSQGDFPELRQIFAGWGILHVMLDNELTPEAMLAGYRHMMETLAPDVIAIPAVFVDDTWKDEDVTAIYWELRKIGEEYARNMRWQP